MHVPSLQRFHVFSEGINFVEHHKLAAILGIIVVLGLVYVLNSSTDFPMVTPSSAVSAGSLNLVGPLTLLDDPQYTHEYDTRAQYINAHLERLRNITQPDRAYVVVYNYDPSLSEVRGKISISTTFEVGQEGFTYHIRDFQGLARVDWLHTKRGERVPIWFSPLRSCGLELFNDQNVVIGYLGIEYLNPPPILRRNDMDVLEQTADSIQVGLLQPLERLNISEEH